jgi:hypothetical protein
MRSSTSTAPLSGSFHSHRALRTTLPGVVGSKLTATRIISSPSGDGLPIDQDLVVEGVVEAHAEMAVERGVQRGEAVERVISATMLPGASKSRCAHSYFSESSIPHARQRARLRRARSRNRRPTGRKGRGQSGADQEAGAPELCRKRD